MSVVNCKVVHIRPVYKDLKEWMEDKNNVYIGRRGIVFVNKVRWPLHDSLWANPFNVGRDGTRDEVIEKYRVMIIAKLSNDNDLRTELEMLRGKNLGCWCAPEACHGNVLLDILNQH